MLKKHQSLPPPELTAENSWRPLPRIALEVPYEQNGVGGKGRKATSSATCFPPILTTVPCETWQKMPNFVSAILVHIPLSWLQHSFTAISNQALTHWGWSRARSLCDQSHCRTAASSRASTLQEAVAPSAAAEGSSRAVLQSFWHKGKPPEQPRQPAMFYMSGGGWRSSSRWMRTEGASSYTSQPRSLHSALCVCGKTYGTSGLNRLPLV